MTVSRIPLSPRERGGGEGEGASVQPAIQALALAPDTRYGWAMNQELTDAPPTCPTG